MNGHKRAAAVFASLVAVWQLGSTSTVLAANAVSASGATTVAFKDDKSAVAIQLSNLTRAVAAGDAKMLAGLWTEDGTYTDDDGNVFNGRQALDQHFRTVFQTGGGFAVDLVPEQFRGLAKGVAMSEGTVRRADSSDLDTRYSAIFTNQNGKWQIATMTETPVAPKPIASQLTQLEWLIGDWTAENGGNKIHVKSQWAGPNKNFIIERFDIQKQNQPLETDTQIIGWDPRIQSIVSWHFDSSGGFAHGKWSKAHDKWFVASMGVLPDGQNSEALNIMHPQDANDFSFQSVRRRVGGTELPGTDLLLVHRVTSGTN
jgi:uncharacterized protein (TIGR02246 family)